MNFQGKSNKITYGALLVTIVLILTGCGGSGSSGSSDSGDSVSGSDSVTISGEFDNGSYAHNNWFDNIVSVFLPAAHAFDPSKVSKVLAFFGDGRYAISDVAEEGSFSIDVAKGSPIGLIFVGDNDNYLGYLTLGNDVDSLPLHYDEEDIATIDLQTLSSSSSSDNVVYSRADVLEKKFQISQEEQKTLGYADNLFAAIVKNPDVDGNGTIDFLENKFFRLYIMYYFYGGDFEGNLTPTVNQPSSEIWNGYKFGLRAGADWPETVYFSGPEGSGYNQEESTPPEVYENHTFYYSEYSENLNAPDYPPLGEYVIKYTLESGPGTLTFHVPDQSEASENLVLPIPTVELNDNGSINKVSWIYQAAKEDAFEVKPRLLIDNIELQISGTGDQCEVSDRHGSDRMYNSGNLSADTQEHTLECQYLLWDTVTNITLAYDDVYGSHNVVTWEHKEEEAL